MLAWFDTREVDAFADQIVADLRARYPASGFDVAKKKDVERVLKSVDRLLARVEELARRGRLNVYKKARFGNRVKWGLREAQYPDEFADAMTHELVTQLTLASRKAAGG
jgi:hypothetical protein